MDYLKTEQITFIIAYANVYKSSAKVWQIFKNKRISEEYQRLTERYDKDTAFWKLYSRLSTQDRDKFTQHINGIIAGRNLRDKSCTS